MLSKIQISGGTMLLVCHKVLLFSLVQISNTKRTTKNAFVCCFAVNYYKKVNKCHLLGSSTYTNILNWTPILSVCGGTHTSQSISYGPSSRIEAAFGQFVCSPMFP